MATITKRVSAKGLTTYQGKIRIKRKGVIIHQESQTFDKKKNAEQWARNREVELDSPRELIRVQHRGITVGEVLQRYQEDFSSPDDQKMLI